MESNKIKMACYARHFIIFLLLIFSTIIINGQSISKYYSSSMQGNAMLYYILPQTGFNNCENNNSFIYDITYLTTNEYATFNFSYYDKLKRTIDSIGLGNSKHLYSCGAKKLFIETKKKKWHYRYSSQIFFTDLNSFFNFADKPKIVLYTKEGTVELSIKEKTWKNQSDITNKILTLIKYNK